MENLDTIINDILFEGQRRIEWFLRAPGIHCIPADLFSKISSERICELYCTELDYFKRSLHRIGSECTHYKTGQKGIITRELISDNFPDQYGVYWYNGIEGKEHAILNAKYGVRTFWNDKRDIII